MAAYWAKHPHIFPCLQLFPKLCAVEVDGLRCPLCTFRFGAIYQHRENVFIIFHVAILRWYDRTCRIQAAVTFVRLRGCSAFSLAGRWPARQNGCGGNMANDKNKPERYSHEWNQALQRFVAAGQRLLVDNHAAAALAQLSESGTLLGWIVPIENK